MRVIKRNGNYENVSFDKVLRRIQLLSNGLNVDYYEVASQVIRRIYDGVKTTDLDELTANHCSSLAIEDPDYGILAARVVVSNLHKNTEPSFSKTIELLYNNKPCLIAKDVYEIVKENADTLDSWIDHSRDDMFDYFGFKTLERSYLLKKDGIVAERPQHMFMRVAIGIHKEDIKSALETYDGMSLRKFTHATPTLFNAGTPNPQCSSCFLVHMIEDSIDGIFDTLKETAIISKYAGGIGLHVHNIRGKGSVIKGTNGTSDGLLTMLRVFNNTARYVNQAGKRAGSIAIYLEPWHADVFDFLELKKPHGHEEQRARDLFYAMWINDLFMERVQTNGVWSLMSPDVCPGLSDCWGNDFKELYEEYERQGKYVKKIKAQELWFKILECQIESGTPYLLYKDAANKKSNQQNLGTIKSSNLCVAPETMILTDKGYYPIKDLHGQQVSVWNGEEFSETVVHQTGHMQKLITVKFSNGMSIRCTPYHKFYIEWGKRPNTKSFPRVIEAKDLQLGDYIIRYELPTINSEGEDLKYAYTHGLFCADGTYQTHEEGKKHQCNYQKWNGTDFCKRHQNNIKIYDDDEMCCAESFANKPMLWLYGEKKKLINDVQWVYYNPDTTQDRLNVALPYDIKEKYYVPLNGSLDTKLRWLEGYLDGDGTISSNNGAKNLQVSSSNKEFLTNVFFLLQTLGVNCVMSVAKQAGKTILPDGKGGQKEYNTQKVFRINVSCSHLLHLKEIGFNPKRLNVDGITSKGGLNRFIKVTGIEDKDDYDDTYCFNEPRKHKGIFNGIITGQCSEIIQYTSRDEISICNLASICLPTFVESDSEGRSFYNFEKLHEVAKTVTKNLNKVIDINFYPLEKGRTSNFKHRPIGIGVQGLADTFALLHLPFDSPEAKKLNRDIFETIYHGSVQTSMEIARNNSFKRNPGYDLDPSTAKYPGAYSSFEGSPASKGMLQFDLWGVNVTDDRYNWSELKSDIQKYGMRNSLLLAPMPTASTSQIMGFNECFEPFTSNLYKRRTMAGEFVVVNKHLVKDLQKLGLWSEQTRTEIIVREGSIQDMNSIPDNIKAVYKTAWEMSQKTLIDLAADRGAFVCQSQSLNLFVEDPDFKKLSSMHFYAWKKGLKTGIYYLRTRAKARAQMFTIDPSASKAIKEQPKKKPPIECTPNEDGVCMMCSS